MANSPIPAPDKTPDPILQSLKKAEKDAVEGRAQIARASDLIPYVKVLDPKGLSLSPMEPWPLAIKLLDDFWPNHKRTVTKKPRQVGVSWDFALYCLYHLGWKGYRTAGSVNYNQEVAGELLWRMRVLWQTMPPRLRPPLRKGTEFSTSHVEFVNGSRAVALATKDVSGAGYTFSLLGIDEAGLIANLGDNWAALLPAVEMGELHMFSTPRSDTGKFAEVVKACVEGDTTFAYREILWNERPGRDEAWKAARVSELGQRSFDREYGGAFTRPGSAYFDDEIIKKLRAAAVAPKSEQWGGKLKVWETARPGCQYVIGADVAEGVEDGDYSAAQILDRKTGRQVATFHARLGITEYAERLVALAQIYNRAWLAIEANNHGHAVCQWAYRHCRYHRIHRESREGEGRLGTPAMRLGILTTTASKPAMLAAVENGLRTSAIQVYDAGTIEELAAFLSLTGGAYGAPNGQHDDLVMALLLAQAGRGRGSPRSF